MHLAQLSKPRGREIFLKLIARAGIWMESSKPGTCKKWNLDDTTIWKVNPKLVITQSRASGKAAIPTTSIARRTTWLGRRSAA